MEQRALGASGLFVSQLGLGAMTWGRDTDIHEAKDLVKSFYSAGGRLIDTADIYCDGASEEIVGAITKDFPDLVISTKAGAVRSERRIDLSRRNLINSLDQSLIRLRRKTIDVWHMHGWDSLTASDEVLNTIEQAINSGRVQYVGLSNVSGWQLATLAQLSKSVRIRIFSTQAEYSLLDRKIETELLPAAIYHDVGFMSWSPLGRGVLTGKYRFSTPADSRAASSHLSNFVAPYLSDRAKPIVDSVCTAAEGLGCTPAQVALAWVLANPAVSSAIIGPRTVAQLNSILQNFPVELPMPLYQALAEVSA